MGNSLLSMQLSVNTMILSNREIVKKREAPRSSCGIIWFKLLHRCYWPFVLYHIWRYKIQVAPLFGDSKFYFIFLKIVFIYF